MDTHTPLMPAHVWDLFMQYITHPETLTRAELQQLRDYVHRYGRLKVLNAVAASRSHHLDALTK